MKKFYLLALVAAMFAACATDVTEDVAIEAPETLKVSFEESSRIQLDDNKTVWTKGDLVSVFYRSDANQQWKFQGKTGDREGILKRVSAPEATEKLSKIVAVYPYCDNYYINPETCNIEATLPAEQTYLKDSYGLDGNLLVSATEFNQLYLRNVCGWLKIQLKGEGQVVKKITLKGNNGEQVAGLIYVDSSDATATLAAERSAGGDDGVGGTLVFEDTILTEVALNCPNGVTLGSESAAFYIALPPQEFSKGVTLKVFYADGTTMTKSTSNSIEIARNTILPMSTLYYDGNVPPVYELAYTTNDGEPLDPLTTEGFGANFVENIFDPATGKGALKFNGRITTIPEKAFISCTNLSQIELTKDITTINAEAFSNCTALAIMDIPQGVKTIGDKAFYNCSGMTEIAIPSSVTSIKAEAFSNCRALTVMDIPQGVKTIGDKAFYNCGGITEITIPSSVTSIGTSSFEDCGGKANINCRIYDGSAYTHSKFYKAKFSEVIIGNSITSIGDYAFEDCTSLTSVTIPDSVTEIGRYAFFRCTSLKEVHYTSDLSAWCKINFAGFIANPMNNGAKLYLNGVELTGDVTIPSDVTEIKDYTFHGCTSLTSVTIGDRVTTIGSGAFYECTSLTSVTIGNRVTEIGGSAFLGCTSLTSVIIPDSVTEIGGSAFLGCTSLTSVIIPDSVTEIGDCTFTGCTSLTSVTIPDRVTEIGVNAFGDCTSLTSVTIPDRVTSIGSDAFWDCTSLKEVYCKPTTPPSEGSDMFDSNASGRKIYVPRASVDAYKAAWSDYADAIEPYDF